MTDRDSGEWLGKNRTLLAATNASAGAGETATLLVIGDSLTAGGEHTAVLNKIAANDSVKLELVGTRGQSRTNRHEGRGGWTVRDYATYGRPGQIFTVAGVSMPPGGDPATSAPEELYKIEGVPSQYSWCVSAWSLQSFLRHAVILYR